MANRKINIALKSGFDPRGVSDASRSIDQLRSKFLATNKWMLEINADLSRAIRQVTTTFHNHPYGNRLNNSD